MDRKFFMVTFGCQMNEHDSALIAGILTAGGYTQVESIELAEIVVVNTCCIRQTAEQKIRSFLGSLKPYAKASSNFMVVVYGCMVQAEGNAQKLSRFGDYIGVLAGTFAMGKLPAYIEDFYRTGKKITDISDDAGNFAGVEGYRPLRKDSLRAEVRIISGCNNFCSYCIVPYVRGREQSRNPGHILAEIRALANSGYKEILLLGQNVNSFGCDFDTSWTFARLLKEISAIDGIEWIRYMSSHPKDFNDNLLETIFSQPKICKQFHLPLQSGSDRILKEMNRVYTKDFYRELLQKIRSFAQEITITTDLIIGFPGETEAEAEETLGFIKECQFDAAYTFLYSQRSGTAAALMDLQIPNKIKKERLLRLAEAQNAISLAKNQALIGKKLRILPEGASKNNKDMHSARTEGNKIVIFSHNQEEFNKNNNPFLDATIVKANTWNLFGEIKN